MAFEWKSVIDVAEKLQDLVSTAADGEAYHRSAVSRAYFGAFGHAKSYAVAFLNYDTRGDHEDHGRLRAHLKTKKRWAVSEHLRFLRDLRNEADYHDELPWTDKADTVATAIQRA